MSNPVTPTDELLAKIANNDIYLINALRALFDQAGTLSPDLIDEALLAAGNAENSANQANSSIDRLARAVELLALNPKHTHIDENTDLTPSEITQERSDDLTPSIITQGLQDDLSPVADQVGTDNSTNVTLAGSPNYITILGQVITRALINLTSHVTGLLPLANGGTNASNAAGARTNLNVDVAGTDNSTNVTLAGTPNYITIVGQVITRALINLTSHVTGILPLANGGTNDAAVTAANIGHLKSTNQDLGTTDSVIYDGIKTNGRLNIGTNTELTISSGVVTVTGAFHRVDTEGDAAGDDLDTIAGATLGDRVVIMSVTSSRQTTLKDGTNLRLAGDFTLTSSVDTIELLYLGTVWVELSRSNNA
jgi:hypothetical protein